MIVIEIFRKSHSPPLDRYAKQDRRGLKRCRTWRVM